MIIPAWPISHQVGEISPGSMRQGLGNCCVLYKHKGMVLFNQGTFSSSVLQRKDLERVCVYVHIVLSFWLVRRKSVYLNSARVLVTNVE